MKIAFSINDWCEQQLELTTDEFTPEEVFAMIQGGDVLTSIQEGGDLVLVDDTGIRTIGTVISSEPGDGEYFDFAILDN